jgi:hypothetical protein
MMQYLNEAGIRAAERWRSFKVTEFERRQMAAVRKELHEEYKAAVGLNIQPSQRLPPRQEYPATLRLDRQPP